MLKMQDQQAAIPARSHPLLKNTFVKKMDCSKPVEKGKPCCLQREILDSSRERIGQQEGEKGKKFFPFSAFLPKLAAKTVESSYPYHSQHRFIQTIPEQKIIKR